MKKLKNLNNINEEKVNNHNLEKIIEEEKKLIKK